MKYVATATVTAHASMSVRLTPAQTERCLGLISKPDKKGFVTVLAPIQFKVGEVFETRAELPKIMADLVDDPETAAKEAAEAAAEAQAAAEAAVAAEVAEAAARAAAAAAAGKP